MTKLSDFTLVQLEKMLIAIETEQRYQARRNGEFDEDLITIRVHILNALRTVKDLDRIANN